MTTGSAAQKTPPPTGKWPSRSSCWAGITQFLDLGAGLPTRPSVHEAVREVNDAARVAYVDNDPLVFSQATALLADTPGVTAADADIISPDQVLAAVGDTIDLRLPVCVILGSVVHFFDAGRVAGFAARYMAAVPPGSWLTVSCVHTEDQEWVDAEKDTYTPGTYNNHGPAEFAAWLDGWDLVPPGIAEARRWLSGEGGTPPDRPRGYTLCAAAIKPDQQNACVSRRQNRRRPAQNQHPAPPPPLPPPPPLRLRVSWCGNAVANQDISRPG
jgi:S-adenosyl methyltransferase